MMEEMSLSRAFSENFDCLVSYDSLEVMTNPRHHRCGQPLVTIFFLCCQIRRVRIRIRRSGAGVGAGAGTFSIRRCWNVLDVLFSLYTIHCIHSYLLNILHSCFTNTPLTLLIVRVHRCYCSQLQWHQK